MVDPNSNNLDLQDTVSANRIKGLWLLMRGYRLAYLGAAVCLGIAATSRSGMYLLLRYFADNVLGKATYRDDLPLIALGFVGLAGMTGGFTFLSGALSARTSEGIAQRLRDYLFDHIQRLSFSYHDRTKTGELVQRATSDVDAIRRFYADQAIGVGRIVLLFIVNLGILISLNWQLALFSIIVVPFTVMMSFFFFKRVSKAYEAYQEQDGVLSSVLQENLTGVRVVKAFARQAFERDKFEIENWEKYLRGRRLLLMHSLYWPISDILTGGQMLAGFAMGAFMTLNGVITVGTYLAYAGMVIWIIWPIRNMGRLVVQMSTGLVSYKRISEVIKQMREPLEAGSYTPQDKLYGDFIFKRVSFEYEGDAKVLKDISFHCAPGETVALLGSTGSGKTTLVNLILRFYDYNQGSISLDGIELNRYPRKFLRDQIGIVEQETFLFSRSIRENITYGVKREVSDDEVKAAASAADIHETIMGFPEGYNTLVGEKGVTLSGGQKQRVAIARTILKNPSILILDDATSSVDMKTEVNIRQALERLLKNRTTFIIAHRIQSVMVADLILVFDEGRIVQSGTHDELIAEEGIYKRIYQIQTQIEVELEREIATAA